MSQMFYADVRIRGAYPGYALRFFEDHDFQIEMREEDLEAINYGICSGVKGVFTAHGADISELRKNEALNTLYEEKLFKRIIFLENRGKLGKVYYLDKNMYKSVDGILV